MKTVIGVWFSKGAASAVAAKKTIEIYGKYHDVIIINNPVDEEDADNMRFQKDISNWIGKEIIEAKNSKLGHTSAVQVWADRSYMSGNKGAPCTMLLKKEARYEFEATHKIDWHVLGFCANEKGRHDRFITQERENVIPVLINLSITKNDCYKIIEDAGIELPLSYRLGYDNANCIGCVKSSGVWYWNKTRQTHPEIFRQRAIQSREIGCKLVRLNGKRIFLDELPEDAIGRPSHRSVECSSFCDTKRSFPSPPPTK